MTLKSDMVTLSEVRSGKATAFIPGCQGNTRQAGSVTSAKVMVSCKLEEIKYKLWVSADTDGQGTDEAWLLQGDKVEVAPTGAGAEGGGAEGGGAEGEGGEGGGGAEGG